MRRIRMRQAAHLRLMVVVLVAMALMVTAGCVGGALTVDNVTKKYQMVQGSYDAARQAVRDAYLQGLIKDKLYKEFVEEVDAQAVKADNLIVAALLEAQRLEGVDRDNKLLYVLELIKSFNIITTQAQGYLK